MTETPAVDFVPAAAPAASKPLPRLPFWSRASDRVNPVLVREAQQAMKGRAFAVALTLALAAIVIVALSTASSHGATRRDGWKGFLLGLQVLCPVVLLIVPVQALVSMRAEVGGGTIDHLLLTRLTPGAVVRGKLAGAVVLSLLFFSLFGPLLGLTYLLRGVDVPTIAATLFIAFVWSVGASIFGIALGALGRWPWARVLTLLVGVVGLTIGTVMVTFGLPFLLPAMMLAFRATDAGPWGLVAWVIPVLVTVPLLYLTACASLAHPYENRSTPFRLYALSGVALMLLWVACRNEGLLAPAGMSLHRAAEAVPVASILLGLFSFPFWLFAATEEDRLSPRVRTQVPKNPVLAVLSIPFLPGGARGLLFTVILAVATLGLTLFLPRLVGGDAPEGEVVSQAAAAWLYVIAYASLARAVRSRFMPAGPRGTAIARVAIPGVIAFLVALPHLIEALSGAPIATRSPLMILDPFGMSDEIYRGGGALALVLIVAALALVAQVVPLGRAISEVMAASKERRRRAA